MVEVNEAHRKHPLGGRTELLYGNAAGQWALVTLPDDAPPMPDILGDLALMGTVRDVVLALANRERQATPHGRIQFQRKMSLRLGIGQQAVSTLMRGKYNSRPTNEGLAYLARAFHAHTGDDAAADDD